jgi:excisionase family DNA binding protein
MPDEVQRAIRPGEAARRLGVSTRTVQRWLRAGKLPAVEVGSRLLVGPIAFSPSARPSSTRPIRRLLIANRGELVVRIARTARRMGITTLALAPEDQWRTWWSRQADARVPLASHYLDPSGVLDAARRAGADAIHPGYGFLAEDADFADAVVQAGLLWVGPPASAMRALGDKAAARRLAASLEVPVVPGYDGNDQQDHTLVREADRIGYPLLIKPSGGGGGIGMQLVSAADQFRDRLDLARRQAVAAFGDNRVVLERQIEHARHVEIQLLMDGQGNGVHLGERDCSLQRRHQKVLEEAPAPGVDARTRSRLGGHALRLAREAGYQGVGTAEFLIDGDGNAWFLELNARLQVEHPVTEAVTGRDLVADQLRIAAGEPLGLSQRDVSIKGHAFEARIYAEDPWSDFAPSSGTIAAVRWPSEDGVRVDAGVAGGDTIGTRYDPLLAKVIVSGPTRQVALQRLAAALERTRVVGLTTNRGFLRALAALPEVRTGHATTDTVSRSWQPSGPPALDEALTTAAAVLATGRTGFRLNAPPQVRIVADDQERSVPVDSVSTPSLAWAPDGDGVVVDLDGLAVYASLAPPPTVDRSLARSRAVPGQQGPVRATIPASVREVRARPGSEVAAGQVLLVLEAMKMEHAVVAPAAATVGRILVVPGAQVARGDVLVELS